MPYCNQCGRFIGGGMLCEWCGDTRQNLNQNETPEVSGESLPIPDEVPAEAEKVAPPEEHAEVPEEHVEMPKEPESSDKEEPQSVTEEETKKGTEQAESEAPGRMRETFKIKDKVRFLLSGRDAAFSRREMRAGRWMAALSYLWLLWLIPYFFATPSRYVRHHMTQALPWLLVDCIALSLGGIAVLIVSFAAFLAPLFAAFAEVLLLVSLIAKCCGLWRVFRPADVSESHI